MATKRPLSDHFNGETFFNPTMQQGPAMNMWKGLSMWLLQEKPPWPKSIENKGVPDLHRKLSEHQVAITFVNHASFLIQLPGLNILTDPVWSNRVSPFSFAGPKRARPPGIEFDKLPKIDVVLISHNHYDHMDHDTLVDLEQKFSPQFFVALGDGERARAWGLKNVKEMEWWDEANVSALKITYTPTQHFSSRGLFDRNHSLWGSYMLEHSGKRIYFGGDAGYSSHYKSIRERLGAVDLALLPIGAYEPRWFMKSMHINPEEAVQAHQDLEAQHSIGMHFGTFQLSSELFDQPAKDLSKALEAVKIPLTSFITMDEGSTRVYDL